MTRAEMNEVLGVLGITIEIDSDSENLLWMNAAFEEPDFLDEKPEEYISDAFILDNIKTL